MFKMCVYIHTSQLAWYIHHKSMLASLRLPTYLFFGPMFCCKHWIISGPSFQPGLIRDQVSSSRTSLAPCGWITWILPMPWTTTIADGGSLTRFWKKNGAGVLSAFAHQIWMVEDPKFGASKTGTIGNTKQKKARTNTVYGSLQLRCCF